MEHLQKEYTCLFNAVTEALAQLTQLQQMLMEAQLRAEELYVLRGETEQQTRQPDRQQS